jgi:hypothetical protein
LRQDLLLRPLDVLGEVDLRPRASGHLDIPRAVLADEVVERRFVVALRVGASDRLAQGRQRCSVDLHEAHALPDQVVARQAAAADGAHDAVLHADHHLFVARIRARVDREAALERDDVGEDRRVVEHVRIHDDDVLLESLETGRE